MLHAPCSVVQCSVAVKDAIMSSKVSLDEERLNELGYKQELKRSLSVFSNFAVSFTLISILTGVTTVYNTGLAYGGPISMTYGWLIAGTFTLLVALSMAEICSAFPTSGGLYFWSYNLAGPEIGPFASWITGWFNVLGQWAGACSIDYSLATLLQIIILLSTGGMKGGGYLASKYEVLLFHGAILFLHALINSLPINWLSHLGNIAVIWNIVGIAVLTISIPTISTSRASSEFVFKHFNTQNSHGIHSKPYLFLLGLLMSQYTLSGYDASAHLVEETKSADKNGPYGIISSVAISVAVGWVYVLGITFSVTNLSYLLDEHNDAAGYAVAQIFYDAFKDRYGSGRGGIICLGIVAGSTFFCGMSAITSSSRLVYAFSRDGAIPLSTVWHKVNQREVPANAVWLSATVAFIAALPSLGSIVAFQATVSIATIGMYIAYGLPILLRITLARNKFSPGPFNLGSMGLFVGWVAVIWVAFITILFSLPVQYPIAMDSFNYTPVAVGGVLVGVVGTWVLRVRFWFKGPSANLKSQHVHI